MRSFTVCLLLLCFFSFAARAQFLPEQKNKLFLRLSSSLITYDDLLLRGTETRPLNQKLSDLTFRLYAEYRVSDRIALNVVTPLTIFKVYEAENGVNALRPGYFSGPGNIEAGIRNKLWIRESAVVTGFFTVIMPTGFKDNSRGLQTGYEVFTFNPGLIYAKSWPRTLAYLSTELNLRDKALSSDFGLQGEVAYELFPNFWMGASANLIRSFYNTESLPTSRQQLTGTYVNNQEFLAGGVKAFYEIKPKATVELSTMKVFWGNMIAKDPSVNLGISWRW